MTIGAQGLEGVVLRYASFCGPKSSLGRGGDLVEQIKQRKLPLIGDGAGVWSFIHYDDAADATVKAVDSNATGLYQIADDEPARASIWLPELARILGAKPPRHLPAWLAKLVVGELGVSSFTKVRGADNSPKRTFDWQPGYASWRDGFRHGL
jgi:nucleoside-diphosphate-sugar epimerase